MNKIQLKNSTFNRFDEKILTKNNEKLDSTSKSFSDNRISIDDYYLSPESAAQYLDVSRKFIYELIQSKSIEAVSIGRKLKRIRKRTLDNWLNLQTSRFER